jgi:hypothetical protein
MTDGHVPAAQPAGSRQPGEPPPDGVNWPFVLGLGALAVLEPLAHLTGLRDALGPAVTTLLVPALVALLWIGWVGFFRVPRPVLTLTLAGTVSGAVLVLLVPVLGVGPEVDGGTAVLVAVVETAPGTGLGAVAGFLAWVLQQSRRPGG